MKLKSAIVFPLLLLALASCHRPATRFTVNGSVHDTLATSPGSMVYLIDSDGPVDSAAVNKGSFVFKGSIDSTKLLVIMLQYPDRDPYDERFLVAFVPDTEKISVDLDYPATVTGSPLTDAIQEYREAVMNLYYEHEMDIGSLSMNGETQAADSIYRVQLRKIDDLSRETYLANTGNVLGKQALTQLFDDLDVAELEDLLSKGAPFIKDDSDLVNLLNVKKNAQATGAGAQFIEIEGLAADGNPTKLSDFAGKGNYVLMDFWASWCGPCMMAVPNIREMKDKYASKGLVVVGVNVWEQKPEDGPACATEKQMDWPIIFTSNRQATEAYGIEGIPTLILLAPDGTIAGRLLGEEGLTELLSEHLDE